MVRPPETAAGSLKDVPERQRGLMISGMRWTLWLSIACAPLGYLTTVLLARVGPQVIAMYGVLTLYISLTSVFLFFGGNGVAIKFLPELEPDKRTAFLFSYFLVAVAAVLPYQIAVSLWPRGIQYVLGSEISPRLGVLLVWLAPLYIMFSLIVAALKGLLEIKWAQIYSRVITLINFATYVLLYVFARSFLAAHYEAIIWLEFLALALLVMLLAGRRLAGHLKPHAGISLRLILPQGFWRYTGFLQANCVLDFLSLRLDYIFVLNVGGSIVFGRYFALLTLVSIIPTFATFILDSLLPSLTNTLATRDYASATHLTEIYLRFMLPCGMAAATFASLFAGPIFGILGPKYADLVGLGLIAFPIAAIQVINWFGSTMFTAIGDPHITAVAKAIRCVVFCAAFFPLWHRYGLLGAVLAWGAAEVADQIVLLVLLLRKVPFRFALRHTYTVFLVCVFLSSLAAHVLGNHRPLSSFGSWVVLVVGFFIGARYSIREIRDLLHMILPSDVSAFMRLKGAP